jgi:membrane dipeptidase
MRRRDFLKSVLAAPLAVSGRAVSQEPTYLGDMHFHSFFGQSIYHSRPLAATMAAGRATLISWAISGDALWIEPGPRGIRQKGIAKPGETLGWFEREVARIKAHVAEQGLSIVRGPGDVDRALQGTPHVVLAVEGASFVEDDLSRVEAAHRLGIRHLQLVHFTRNSLGDFQTERPEHNGLTQLGRKVVQECNRLGILVDLAHASAQTVADTLAVTTAPVVWSHSSVIRAGSPRWDAIAWKARQLRIDQARDIARKGGAIGLWALKQDVHSIEGYAARMLELADWIGEDHVAFGTDINGLLKNAVVNNYADVRRVVDIWQQQGVAPARVRKLAIGNFGRVLKRTLKPTSS